MWSGFILLIGIVWGQDIILRRLQKSVQKETEPPSAVQPTAERLWLKGKVVDASSGEALAGAHIKVPGSVLGAIADAQGEFYIPTTLRLPVEVEITYVGYHPQRFTLTPSPTKADPPALTLSPQEIIGEEVVIAASRMEEKFMHSPVQVFPLSGLQLRQSPAGIDAHTISFLPGVDIFYSSITFPIINTRGFNTPQNYRFINRVDGVEMQSVALGIPIFPYTSAPDIDVANSEIIYGPASALYGPNAFNGALITTLRSPFAYRGLSARVRAGLNNIAHPFRPHPSPYFEAQARYAHVWRERLGVKLSLQVMDTEDWLNYDTTDIARYEGVGYPYNLPGSQNPGYQPAGGYGDDVRIYYSGTPLPFVDGSPIPPFYISRTPYFEPEFILPNARIGKASGGIFYRFSDQLQGELTFLLSTGRTFFLGSQRYAFQDFLFQAYKAEITHPRGFLRAYTFREYGGRVWPLPLLAVQVLGAIKPHQDWFLQYLFTYGGYLDTWLSPAEKEAFRAHYGREVPKQGDHAGARWMADSDTRFLQNTTAGVMAQNLSNILPLRWNVGMARPAPSSKLLQAIIDSVGNIPINRGGALIIDRCALYHTEGQYELPPFWGFQTIVGGSFRVYEINSERTVFIDTIKPLYNWEAGAYTQLRRSFWNERVIATVGLRYDYRQYLGGQLTPRLSLSYALTSKGDHVIRAGYQMGFRNAVNDALFIRLTTPASILIGALPQIDKEYGIANGNNFTAASVSEYRAARARGVPPEQAAALLRSLPLGPLRPEKVYSFEIGSRHFLFGQKLFIDVCYAYQFYKDFHANIQLYGPADRRSQLTYQDVENRQLSPLYFRYYNAPGTPKAHFFTIATQYRLTRHLALAANYGYANAWDLNEAVNIEPSLSIYFNTPLHRANVSLELLDWGRWRAQINYQWVDKTFFSNMNRTLPSYQLLHAQISYRLPRIHSEIRLGAQNLLNFYHIEIPFGPYVGGLYYLQYSFSPLEL